MTRGKKSDFIATDNNERSRLMQFDYCHVHEPDIASDIARDGD